MQYDPFASHSSGSQAPPPPPANTGGQHQYDPFASHSQAQTAPPGKLPPLHFATPPLAPIATGVGKALDYQGWQVRKALTGGEKDTDKQMEKIRAAIPGVAPFYKWLGNMHQINAGPPLPYIEPYLDKFGETMSKVSGNAAQGLVDASIEAAIDPLTYETLGFGATEKFWGKPAAQAFMAAVNKTPYARYVYDALNWGGEVARTHAPGTVSTLRGAANRSSAEGARVEQHFQERYDNVVNGHDIKTAEGRVRKGTKLSPQEKKRVAQALNNQDPNIVPGKEGQYEPIEAQPGEASPYEKLTPKEQTAYRQLRTLTALNYAMRTRTAQTIAFNKYTKDLSEADKDSLKQAYRSGKPPVIPAPEERVLQPYGEPVARTRAVYGPPPDINKATEEAFAGLNAFDKTSLGRAFTDDAQFARLKEDAPELYERAAKVREAYAQKYGGRPQQTIDLTPRPKYTFMPRNQKEIERMQKLNHVYNQINGEVEGQLPYREHYVPFKHEASDKAGRPGFTTTVGHYFDPQNISREEIKVTNPKQLDRGFAAMASNTGRQVTTKAIHDSLGELLDHPEIKKLFTQVFPATGAARTTEEQLKEEWLHLVGYPRAAVTGFTPRHGFNILDLVANTVPLDRLPQVMGQTLSLAYKLWKSSPREYAELTKEGRLLGSISGRFRERKPFFQHVSDWVPGIGGRRTFTDIPQRGGLQVLPIKRIGLGAWTDSMNKLVWAIDDAAKQTYGKWLRDSGEAKGLEAGGLASQRLIDYEHLSPVQKALREIAPFGTFRGGIPGAVLGGIARGPVKSAFLNRATGGALYGSKPQTGKEGVELSLPTAEVGRGLTYREQVGKGGRKFDVSGPGDFLQATLGAPASAIGGAALNAIFPSKFPASQNPLAYGQTWLPKRLKNGQLDLGFIADSALAGVPEAQAFLEAMGLSRFQWHGLAREALRQSTGVNLLPAAAPPAPLAPLQPVAPASATPAGYDPFASHSP